MPLGAWQGMQLYSGYSSFYKMCDAIEGTKLGDTEIPNEDGIGLPRALDNFAKWWSDEYFPGSKFPPKTWSNFSVRLSHSNSAKRVNMTSIQSGAIHWRLLVWTHTMKPAQSLPMSALTLSLIDNGIG